MQATSYRLSKLLLLRTYRPLTHIRLGFGFISMQAVALGLLLAVFVPVILHAQSTDGAITGTVTDNQGKVLANVVVYVWNTDSGTSRSTKTGPDGQYRINAVPPGTYDLLAERDGFAKELVKNLTITVGLQLQRDIRLNVGSVEQTVSVTGVQPLLDTSSNEAAAAVISTEQIEELPISGRQAMLLALLLPGTGNDATRAQRPNANIGLGSANVAASNYLVDGLYNSISGAGDPRDNIQEAAVQEFQVITTQAPAEYGGRSGGVVSVVTKSGTNHIHGEAFEFFRNHDINRLDYYSQQQHDSNSSAYSIQPFERNQFGGSIGGPILKDRLHLFLSYEDLNDKEYFTVAPGGVAQTAAQKAIHTDYASLAGSFRNGSLSHNYFGRADWEINAKHSAFLRIQLQNPNIAYATVTGTGSAYSSGDQPVQGWTYGAGETWVISPRIINQVATQVAQSYQSGPAPKYETPSQSILSAAEIPAIAIPAGFKPLPGGTTKYSFPNLSWGVYPSNRFHDFFQEIRDTLTVTRGYHTFKFGGDILNQPRNNSNPADPYGTWTFKNDIYFNPDDPNFDWSSLAAAVPTGFTATLNSLPYQNQNLESALYAQDEWKIKHTLTLNLGLRYDLQTLDWNNKLYASLYPSPGLPSFVHFGGHGVYDNFAPRLGFAWDVRGDGKTVVRGGYGIMYSMNSDDIYGGEIATLRQPSISISNSKGITSFPNPYGVNGQPPTVITQTKPNISVNTNNVSNPPAYTYSVGATRQLGSDIAFNVDGIYSKITKMPLSVNVNAPYESAPGVLLTTSANVPLPVYGKITEVETEGNYEYKAILARLEKRYSHHYLYTVSYTLAKQRDNYNSGLGFSGASRLDAYYPNLDLGQAAADRRNVLVLSGSTKLPFGIVAGGIYTLRSSTPLSATYTVYNSNGGASTAYYVPGTTKGLHNKTHLLYEVNAWRATQSLSAIPASQVQSNRYNQLDARVSKDINIKERYKFQLVGQLFNVLGTDNFGGIGVNQATAADKTTPTFGEITSAYPRQQGELALRFLF